MRVLACDLDGTLLDATGAVTPRTVRALRRATEAGWVVVLATGRPAAMLALTPAPLAALASFAVMSNGGEVLRLPEGGFVFRASFSLPAALDAVATLRASGQGWRFALETDQGFAHEAGFAERVPHPPPEPAVPDVVAALQGATVAHRLLAFRDGRSGRELVAEVAAVLPREVEATFGGLDMAEVGPAGLTKATGVAHVCGLLGVGAGDVVAFGDNVNDLPLFDWAGHSVAVGDADAETRARADEVAAPFADDGVARVVERLLAQAGHPAGPAGPHDG